MEAQRSSTTTNPMNNIASVPQDNLLNFLLHEASQVWGIVAVFAVIGLLLGLFLTRKGRRKLKRYARENREIFNQYRVLGEDPKPH